MDFQNMEEIEATTGKSQPVMSITGGGYARMNKTFVKHKDIEHANFVQLRGWKKDEDILVIGMRFLEKQENNCINIITDKRIGGKTFSLRNFFNHFGKYHRDIKKQKLKVLEQGKIEGDKVFTAEIKTS